MKRRLLAAGCFAAAFAGSALAADMPLGPARAPAYVPFFTWNGFYIGVNGGYGFGRSNWTDTVTLLSTGGFDTTGGLIGGTVGYNVQFGGWVLGIETDVAWSNLKGSATINCVGTCQTSNEWLGTARTRIGYAFDRFMPYITGGAAFGGIKGTLGGIGTFSETEVGWTWGAGIEYAFAERWSAKVEYLYVDLGRANCNVTCSGGNPIEATFTTNLVRGGVNFRF